MNILAINWRCIKNPEKGGAEVHFHEIFKRIVKKGHQVTLVAHKFKNAPEKEIIDGIEIIRIGNKFLFDRQFKLFYKKFNAKESFDLVIDDISKIPLFTPEYIHKPLVGILHHIHGTSLYDEISFPLAFYIINQEKKIPKVYHNTPILTVSESTKKELIELGQPENKIDILFNAIDHDLFGNSNIIKSETPLLTYVGRLKKYKNIELVIDAINIIKDRIPEIKLQIAGTGDYENNLKDYVHVKGLESRVNFLGYVSEKEKAKILGKAWLFITMSSKEGWGITVTEANAMGTPAIGSNVPGLQDSIKDGETGILVPPGNTAVLAREIVELLTNKDKLENMSKAALNWSKKFNWDVSAEHFMRKIKDWYPHLN